MSWHSIASFALGFAFVPAVIGLTGLFVFLGVHFNLNKPMYAAGTGIAFAILIVMVVCGFAYEAARS